MLISIKANNILVYNAEIEFSMKADLHHKHFKSNYVSTNNSAILKTAILIGPNNSGKTNFVNVISTIKKIILNQGAIIQSNLFLENKVCFLATTFYENEVEYLFEIKYDTSKNEYIYERFAEIKYDQYKNKKEENLLIRDTANGIYECLDEELIPVIKVAAKNNIIVHLIDTAQFPTLTAIKATMTAFASSIDIIDMNNIPIKKTIDMLKNADDTQQKIVNFILNADLSLDDYRYLDDNEMKVALSTKKTEKPQEAVLSIENSFVEMLHLASVYKGVTVPSMLFDSTGTKKIAAIASYVIDALEHNRILIVDELDNSLHFKLTRAIIALFNNELNSGAQLIATVHDVSLLDCKTLFRKDQIWFTHKDRDNAYLYSLSEFTAEKDNVRNTSDLIERYRLGVFGALPEPDIFKSLMEIKNNG